MNIIERTRRMKRFANKRTLLLLLSLPLRAVSRGKKGLGASKRFVTRRALVLILLPLLAIPVTLKGYSEATWQDPQIVYYNQGLAHYRTAFANGDTQELATAVQLFQKSIAAYESESHDSRLDHLLHGGPSTEVAALANLHEAVALLAEGELQYDPKLIAQAVDTFKAAIKLNPGVPYSDAIAASDVDRLAEEALPAQYDLELLFNKHKDQSQQPARPKPGQNSQKPGDKPAPGQNPKQAPGHGSPNGI
jgi:hypothetical protein